MERHLHLVPAGADLLDAEPVVDGDDAPPKPETNVVSLDDARRRRSQRYHPAAGRNWLDDLFDEEDDDYFPPLDPIA